MRPHLATELTAGAISAAVMLPQAVVLATLAGLPPEHGIYASVLPAIVATLFGSNCLVLTGPNTAIALMAGSLVASVAAFDSPAYTALMLLICLLVGIVQLGLGLCRGAALLKFLPASALGAVTSAVGASILLSQLSTVTGVLYQYDDPAWINAWRCVLELEAWDGGALLVGIATLAACSAASRARAAKFAIPAGMACGLLAALLWTACSARQLDMLGRLDVLLLAPSLPHWSDDYLPYGWQIALAACSIALVGILQTAVIGRSVHPAPLRHLDLGREMRAQGLANLCAALTSGMPVSGSFNRSAAHAAAGAQTALSSIAASAFLLLAAYFGTGLICYLPMPVMGGVLMHIGLKLIDWPALYAICRKRDGASVRLIAVIACGIFIGITAAVLAAVMLAVIAYLRVASTPAITLDRRDLRYEQTVTFDGDLFFGSVQALEGALHALHRRGIRSVKLVLLSNYIDPDGLDLLERERVRWCGAGARFDIDRPGRPGCDVRPAGRAAMPPRLPERAGPLSRRA